MKKYYIYSLLGLFLITLFAQCAKDEVFVADEQEASDVVLKINEIVSNSDKTPDWLEIYNPGEADVDISGFGVYDKPDAKFTFPDGTVIKAGGYKVLICDKDLAQSSDTVGNFGLSSGGESVTLVDKDDKIIDQVEFPALDPETSYARIPDGSDNWAVANPTQGAANSNENTAPNITADTIAAMDDNHTYTYTVTVSDASGVSLVRIFYKTSNTVKFENMAPLGSGEYVFMFPQFAEGENVEYYIEATDATGLKSYFPASAPDKPLKLTVENGKPVISNFKISTENPAENEEVTVSIDVYDVTGLKNVRLYYTTDGNAANATEVDMTDNGNGNYSAVIPGFPEGTQVSYLLRAKDEAKLKSFIPESETDAIEDDASLWATYKVEPPKPLEQLVINELICKDDDAPYYTDGQGDGADWVELYNGTDADINIAGYYFTDKGENAADDDKYQLPTDAGDIIVPSHGYLVLIFGAADADGNDMEGVVDGKVFVPIGLKASKDIAVAMWDKDGNLVDVSEKFNADGPFGELEDEKSLGRKFDAAPGWKVWDTPTPGAKNE